MADGNFITINNQQYQLRTDGILPYLAEICGHELKECILQDADGKEYPATICEDMKMVWLRQTESD